MKKRIWISGAAQGLGLALARQLAEQGHKIFIADINETAGIQAQQELSQHTEAFFMKVDVTKDEDFVSARKWLEQNWGGIDWVFNNAGVAVGGNFEDIPLQDWNWIYEINVMGVVRGCREFLPLLKASQGKIINTASIAGIVFSPRFAPYNATKAAVVALSEGLRSELKDTGIKVTVVCPYFFKTGLGDHSRMSDAVGKTQANYFVNRSQQKPEIIASRILKAVQKGRFYCFPDFLSRFYYFGKGVFPDWLYTLLSGIIIQIGLRRSVSSK